MPFGDILMLIKIARLPKRKAQNRVTSPVAQKLGGQARFGAGKRPALPLSWPLLRFDMHIPLSPTTIHPPFSSYSNGVEVPAGQKLVFCSGQLGIQKDGTVPSGAAEQTELCFDNIAALLAESGLGLEHVVRINAFVSAREHLRPYMDARNRRFSPPFPASTLMIVSGFARPEFVVEVEVVAAGPAGGA
jgi:enamine deaminase RidA (YjgF/YER057c/UK114 family)